MATDPIEVFYSKIGRYPGNNKQWWLARSETDDPDASPVITAGDFLPEILDKLFAGNMRAPRGHYVLNAFIKDRTAISGITNIPSEEIAERPTTVAFYAGRAWFGCNSTVYFSQVLTDKHKAGLCHQEADPTSEHVSDPIATDGGVVPIPEAHKIVKLLPHGGGVLVFAINGVWHVTGTQAGFSATDISVNKVSPIGCEAPQSVVETNEAVFWWGRNGIYAASQSSGVYGAIPGSFDKLNISETSIQAFYNDIPDDIKATAKGVYDPKTNVIAWLYRDSSVSATRYNRVLFFNPSLEAFYPWRFSTTGITETIKGIFTSERENSIDIETDVEPSHIEYITISGNSVRFAQARNTNFVDWEEHTETGLTYDSYVETGYELFDDAMRNKNITYLFSYFRRTENTFFDADGTLDQPSSCYLTVKWDWASGDHSNKWTDPVQVYRPRRLLLDNPDTGFGMVISKNKVRGNGKAIQFRFGTDERGRDFDLQGWSIAVTGESEP